ncbi:hypothetical protein AC1031_018891 [Aphanomyces cochlioides]|nr:hypothetical protein AC1031_018891 [Aphanomyces cochlioides]
MDVTREHPGEMSENVKAYLELDNQTRIRMESWRGKELQPSPLSELPVEISHKYNLSIAYKYMNLHFDPFLERHKTLKNGLSAESFSRRK